MTMVDDFMTMVVLCAMITFIRQSCLKISIKVYRLPTLFEQIVNIIHQFSLIKWSFYFHGPLKARK